MKKLLVLTGSSSLPRPISEPCYFEQTWPGLFENEFKVYQCSKGGATSKDLYDVSWYAQMYRPDIVVIQIGLFDCAPRAFTIKEITTYKFLWLTRYLFKCINKFFGKNIRTIRKKRNVSIGEYETNLKLIKKRFGDNVAIYAISNIINDGLERINKGISVNTHEYNDVMKQVFKQNYIPIDDLPIDYLMDDFHHPNGNGHQFIYDRIIDFLKRDNLL